MPNSTKEAKTGKIAVRMVSVVLLNPSVLSLSFDTCEGEDDGVEEGGKKDKVECSSINPKLGDCGDGKFVDEAGREYIEDDSDCVKVVDPC